MNDVFSETIASYTDIAAFKSRFTSVICSEELYVNDDVKHFSARFECVHLGAVDIYHYEVRGFSGGCRSMRHIRSDPADDFLLLLPLNAPVRVSQLKNESVIEPGSFAFLSTLKPHAGSFSESPLSEHLIKVPGTLLRQHIPQVDSICSVPINLRSGAGKVMRDVIDSLLAEGHTLASVEAQMLGSALLNTVGAVTLSAPELRRVCQPATMQAQERLRLKAIAFIESNLSNPELDTARIADHCNVSLRYLHSSFESASLRVGALIRGMRLQRCRIDLANPALQHESIIQIALRWGFSSSTTFTRAYRNRFGAVPSKERPLRR
ncbi:MAG: helix-turn-helix domain-containing protein [Steroidobacteraceae bacterium]